jgi:hypothetical protein
MKKSKMFHKILGIIFIISGVILYPTPMPGTSVLVIIGFTWFIGKDKTLLFFKKFFNKKMFKLLKVKSIVKKI